MLRDLRIPFCLTLLLSVCVRPAGAQSVADLIAAYPGHLSQIDGNSLVWRDGTRMPISDGIAGKDFETLLDKPDLDDMFAQPYRAGPPTGPPRRNQDPGRIRYEPFFLKMYGDCRKGEVQARLRRVKWMPSRGGGTVAVTSVNGVAERLEAVVRELETLPAEFTRYLVPSGGTLNCRSIAGTNRRSMHAYGAAIDINTSLGDYWRWPKPSADVTYRNRIPFEIVEVFERHGFIWGGKWYHYDTMHFEYRPELLRRAGS